MKAQSDSSVSSLLSSSPRSSSPLLPLLPLLLGLGVAAPLRAEVRSGQTVVVQSSETIDDNLYVAGGTVMVHGVVHGDLIAAGGTVLVDGSVSGDVLAAGGQVTVSGPVDGDICVSGGQLSVLAPVNGDTALASRRRSPSRSPAAAPKRCAASGGRYWARSSC